MRTVTLIVLCVCQGAQALTLPLWLVAAGLSVMAFDAPGSTSQPQPYIFVAAVASYPLWLVAAGGLSWFLFAKRHHVAAMIITAVFTIPAAVIAWWLWTNR